MPTTTRPPSGEDQMTALVRRVEQLERGTKPTVRPATIETAIFSGQGPVQTATSAHWPVTVGGQITGVTAVLVAAATSSTVLRVFRNGLQIGPDLTIASGVTAKAFYLGSFRCSRGDSLQVVVVTAGAGAVSLTVAVEMKG